MRQNPKVSDILQFLNRLAPASLAEDWDSVGLQVGNLQDPIHGILTSLDVTEAALWEAVEHKCNLLITHHPIFIKPLRCLDDTNLVSRNARLAVQLGINILSFHTNLDSTQNGLNDQLARQLGLENLKPLLTSRDSRWPRAGLGRIGKLKKTSLGALIEKSAKDLGLKHLRYVGNPKTIVEKIAVMTGSGGGFFLEAKAAGADVLVTGDVKYHHALDALAEGIAVIDIGHFAGEIGMVPLLAQALRRWARQKKIALKIFESQTGVDPFRFWGS